MIGNLNSDAGLRYTGLPISPNTDLRTYYVTKFNLKRFDISEVAGHSVDTGSDFPSINNPYVEMSKVQKSPQKLRVCSFLTRLVSSTTLSHADGIDSDAVSSNATNRNKLNARKMTVYSGDYSTSYWKFPKPMNIMKSTKAIYELLDCTGEELCQMWMTHEENERHTETRRYARDVLVDLEPIDPELAYIRTSPRKTSPTIDGRRQLN